MTSTANPRPANKLRTTVIQRTEIKGCQHRDLWFVLDTSGSMAGKMLRDVQSSALDIFGSIVDTQDRVEVCAFGSTVSHPLPLAKKDTAAFQTCMASLKASGQTALWDAIVATIDRVAEQKFNQNKRFEEVVIFTDGDDNKSQHTFLDVVAKVARPGCVLKLFVIAVGSGVSEVTREQLAAVCAPAHAKLFLESNASGIIEAFGKVKRELVRTVVEERTVQHRTVHTQRFQI